MPFSFLSLFYFTTCSAFISPGGRRMGRMEGWREGGMTVWINCAVLLLQFTHSSRPIRANSLYQHRGLLNPLPSSSPYLPPCVPNSSTSLLRKPDFNSLTLSFASLYSLVSFQTCEFRFRERLLVCDQGQSERVSSL